MVNHMDNRQFSIGQGFLPEVQLKLSIIHVRAITSAFLLCSKVHLQTIPHFPRQPKNTSPLQPFEVGFFSITAAFLPLRNQNFTYFALCFGYGLCLSQRTLKLDQCDLGLYFNGLQSTCGSSVSICAPDCL